MQDRTDSLGINPSYGISHHSGVWDVLPVDQGPTVQVNLLLSGYVCPYVFMDRCTFFKGDKMRGPRISTRWKAKHGAGPQDVFHDMFLVSIS